MPLSDDMPSLASLRRRGGRRPVAPSLFDLLPEEDTALAGPVSTVDVIAEISRAATAFEKPAPPRVLPPPVMAAPVERERVWSVGELVREVRGLVEKRYALVTIEGEISNWRPASSGHCYFTLKDGNAQLSVVMFRKQAQLVRFRPGDGSFVRLRGQVSVYESRGQMQLIAEGMEEVGQGALLAAVQRLKERLRDEGLFDRKRALPAFPRCIGVITSLHGAALRDIVKVCRRRHAAVNLLIYPAAVQGPRCAQEVIAGLTWFSAHAERTDVVLVARGGGSWEDLHGFDDEGVARAIAACAVPVIAGIGHATDSTIADAAADVCAPTPSAAAELVTAAQFRVEERVHRLQARVARAGRYELLRAARRLLSTNADVALRRWRDRLLRREQTLDDVAMRAESAVQRSVRRAHEQVAALEARLERHAPAKRIVAQRRQTEVLEERLARAWMVRSNRNAQHGAMLHTRLDALNPLRVLERGYALVYGLDGKLVRSADSVVAYDTITARFAKGAVRARVTGKVDERQGVSTYTVKEEA